MAPTTGFNNKLYRNTGSVATPVWSEVNQIGDVSIDGLTRGLAELKRRATQFTLNLPSLIQSITASFRLHHGLDSSTFTALRQAFFAATVIEWAIMDGDIDVAAAEGLRIPMLVSDFPWEQPLEDVSGHDVKLAVGYMTSGGNEVVPSWLVVSQNLQWTTTTTTT